MSRTNPYKIKRRSASKIILIHGEGKEDCVFLTLLRIFYSKDCNVSCKISRGKGGSADGLVLEAYKIQGAYDRKIVVLDDDKPKVEISKARQLAQQKNIKLIEHTPCIEAVLLTILEGKSFKQRSSVWCKKEFESKYIDEKERSEVSKYQRLFPKELLEVKRQVVKELDLLIRLFENT